MKGFIFQQPEWTQSSINKDLNHNKRKKKLYKIQFQKMTVYMMCVKGAIRQTIQAASAHRRMDVGEDKTGLPKRHPIVIFFEKTFK